MSILHFNMSSKSLQNAPIVLVLLLPLIVFPKVFNPYEYGKFLIFVTGVEVVLFLNLIFSRRNFKIPTDKLSILIYLFLFTTLIADLLGADAKTSLLGSDWRLQGFLTSFSGAVLYVLLRNYSKLENSYFSKVALLSAFLISAVAIYQVFLFYFISDSNIETYQGRFVGSMGNPNFLAGFLAMLLPFVLLIGPNRKYQPFLKIFVTGLVLIAIWLSGSRSGMMAIGFIIFSSLIYCFREQKLKNFLVGVVAVCLVFFLFQTIKSERVSIWDNRNLIWEEGIKAVVKRPILGYGQENFELIYPVARNVKVDNAHNIFIETAVSSGIVGLILFALILFTAIKEASVPVKLSLGAFVISGFFNPLSIAQIALFWLLLGLTKARFKA